MPESQTILTQSSPSTLKPCLQISGQTRCLPTCGLTSSGTRYWKWFPPIPGSAKSLYLALWGSNVRAWLRCWTSSKISIKDSAGNKHGWPTKVPDQRNADDTAKDRAKSEPGPCDGDESGALARRRIFRNQCHDVWNGAAEPDPAEKAKQGRLLDGGGGSRANIEDAEPHNRDDQGSFAAQPVGGISEQKGADQHRCKHRAELTWREFPFRDDAWRNLRGRLRVEAVTHDDED